MTQIKLNFTLQLVKPIGYTQLSLQFTQTEFVGQNKCCLKVLDQSLDLIKSGWSSQENRFGKPHSLQQQHLIYLRHTEHSPRSPNTPIWTRLEHFSTHTNTHVVIHSTHSSIPRTNSPTPLLTLSPQLSLLSSIRHRPFIIIHPFMHSAITPPCVSPLLHWGLSD